MFHLLGHSYLGGQLAHSLLYRCMRVHEEFVRFYLPLYSHRAWMVHNLYEYFPRIVPDFDNPFERDVDLYGPYLLERLLEVVNNFNQFDNVVYRNRRMF